MWPTYYIPGLARITTPVQDCWDYLVGTGTERGTADGVLDDPDIVFPVSVGNTYRVLGKLAFLMGETQAKRGGAPRIAWATTGTVEAMQRSSYMVNQAVNDPNPDEYSAFWLDNLEDAWDTEVTLSNYPSGTLDPTYQNVFVDLHITNVSVSGNVVLRWGCVGSSATSTTRVRLTTDTLVVVKEYLPA